MALIPCAAIACLTLYPKQCIIPVMRTYVFRLYPSRDQRLRLDACLYHSRQLYNEMLARQKAHYAETGRFLGKYDLSALFAGRSGAYVPASTVQTLAARLDEALHTFLARHTLDPKVGFPRFKSATRWHSIQLRQWSNDVWLDRRCLHVPKKLGKAIKIKLHRAIEGVPRTCRLLKRADGHWYAMIVCLQEPNSASEEPQPDERPTIGIDMGLKVFLADSNGQTVENPRYYRVSQEVLRRKQRMLSRRRKGSQRRRKAARDVAKTHLKIARQRRDFHFKTAKPYAERYRLIVVEDLHISRMVHSNLAKSIHDAGWSDFLTILTDKAESAGGQVVRINPRFTTQTCSRCGEFVQKSLSVRTHMCPSCGYIADRDVNAAQNILRAGAQPSGTLGNSPADELRSP